MNLEELGTHWNEFGKTDPLWAVLTLPGKENRRSDVNQFFETGRQEIAHVLQLLTELAIPVQRRRALDFGCAVGRLTQALCSHFDECYGVDIAPSMIELAELYNQFGGQCRYFLNRANNLGFFEDDSFTFIYSNIVLQHMKPEYSKNYLREFLRVLVPAGVLVFQIPTGKRHSVAPPPSEAATEGRSVYLKALPVEAYQAQITPQIETMTRDPGLRMLISVKVTNTSRITWPALGAPDARFQIFLGNHWYDPKGRLVTQDDGRVPLPRDVKPGEEVELTVPVITPAVPGKYRLGFDLVQEKVAWFKDKGDCRAASVSVEVKRVEQNQAVPKIIPRMEMYGVPKEEVLEVIRQSGGKLLHVREDQAPGPELESFMYFVTKLERSK